MVWVCVCVCMGGVGVFIKVLLTHSKCSFGALNCTRKDCSSRVPIRQPYVIVMNTDSLMMIVLSQNHSQDALQRRL